MSKNKTPTPTDVLEATDKMVSMAENTPAILIRSILADLNVQPNHWDKLLKSYVENSRSGIRSDKTSRTSERTNANRSIFKSNITWRSFRKALFILNPKKTVFRLEFEWTDEIKRVLDTPDSLEFIPISRQNELAAIFKRLIDKLGINPRSWNLIVEKYLNKYIGDNPPARSSERGNIQKSIIDKKEYPWDIFIKALTIIGVAKVHFIVELTWKNSTTIHSVDFTVQ